VARVGTMRAGDPLAVHSYRLVVSDNGIERTALDLFEEAFSGWQGFLGEWGFVEDTFVIGRPSSL
jgi:hypothetical protein